MNIKIGILLCSIFLFFACKITFIKNKIENGDLVFVESNEQNLSGAISRVTKGDESKISYDHIGIIEKNGNQVYVLHATTKGGSKRESLKSFLKTQGNTRKAIYRLKNGYKSAIPDAIKRAKEMLGKPYNTLYILNDSSYYCSDYIERAFRKDSIFELNPMTFKNPETGEIDDYWKSFYAKYHKEVPEGELGCNPNGLSESSKIQKVFIIQ